MTWKQKWKKQLSMLSVEQREFIVKMLLELRIKEWQNNLLGKRVLGCAKSSHFKIFNPLGETE